MNCDKIKKQSIAKIVDTENVSKASRCSYILTANVIKIERKGIKTMLRIKYEELLKEFERVLISRGFNEKNALDAATVFAQNSLDGIYSHGINRFPRVVEYLDKGEINPDVVATCEMSMGAIERWEGHRGFGPLNAKQAMDRAIELAKQHGIGMVALGNSNHWMRGGSYGWQAADAGCIGICWSNTMPNMPAWGGKDRKIGNNPLILSCGGGLCSISVFLWKD